jgi:hypothetical protein
VFHLDASLLFNSWSIGLATCAWIVFTRRRSWLPLLAGCAVVAALVVGYPYPFRGEVLGRAYAVIHGAALVATAAAVFAWARRRAFPRPEHAAVLLVALLDVAYFGGPYALPDPWATWVEADKVFLAIWGGLLAMHAWSVFDDFLMLPEQAPPPRADLH